MDGAHAGTATEFKHQCYTKQRTHSSEVKVDDEETVSVT